MIATAMLGRPLPGRALFCGSPQASAQNAAGKTVCALRVTIPGECESGECQSATQRMVTAVFLSMAAICTEEVPSNETTYPIAVVASVAVQK